jgi:hypothetical protein
MHLNKWLISTMLMVTCAGLLAGLSITDVQHAVSPGIDGTYPSPYTGRVVTLTGVVTAIGFDGDEFFLSTPEGGPWSGICVSGNGGSAACGDYLEITGKVQEIRGFTSICEISRLEHLGTRSLPPPVGVSVSELNREERFEGVLVCVSNVSHPVVSRGNGHRVSDETGSCLLDDRFAGVTLPAPSSIDGPVTGISIYSFGEYRLNPRTNADLPGRAPVNINRPSWGRVKSLYK